jgi:GT2 family glycosyltransferase
MTAVAPISVAIATLNRPEGLTRCLDALLSGEVLPEEIVVVDQSKDERTQLIVAERSSPRPIIYVRQGKRGLSASRNAGIEHASCSLIAVTDDDCVPGDKWVAVLHHTFASDAALDAVTGRVLPLGPETDGSYNVSPRESVIRRIFDTPIMPWHVGTGGNFAIRRSWFERIGMYDERLGAGSPGKAAEDADLFYRLLRAGAKVQYEPDAIVYHERQPITRRLATRVSYGYGIGAFCGIWLRQGDRHAWSMLRSWLRHQAQAAVGGVRRREWMQVYQRFLSVQGTLRGFIHGVRRSHRKGSL